MSDLSDRSDNAPHRTLRHNQTAFQYCGVSLNWDEGEAEAAEAAASAGAAAVPVRRTAAPRVAEPTAATGHAVRAGCGTSRISSISCVGSKPISAPLIYISVHIIQAPIVGTLLTDSFVSI